MMNKLTLLAAATMMTGLFGVAQAAEQQKDVTRSAEQYIDDAALTAKIKAELATDPTAKAHQIDVEINQGVVQLNGYVDSKANREAAERVARNAEGVKDVRNNLKVRGEETAGKMVDDTVITAKVKTALIQNDLTKAHEINVESQNGVVQLSGFVDSQSQKDKAASIARDIDGVSRVDNNIDVKPRS
jgi:hyperosmotically inducible protein